MDREGGEGRVTLRLNLKSFGMDGKGVARETSSSFKFHRVITTSEDKISVLVDLLCNCFWLCCVMPLPLSMFKDPSVGSSRCGASQDLQESGEVPVAAAKHGGDSVSAGSREDDEDDSVIPSASPAAAITGAFDSAYPWLPFFGCAQRALSHSFLASM